MRCRRERKRAPVHPTAGGRRRCLLPLLVVVLSAVSGARAADGWWNPQWPLRRAVTVRGAGSAAPGLPLGVVEFRTGGNVADDGRDVRVVADGRPVRCRVIEAPDDYRGDFCRVAFEVPPKARRIFVYYGNKQAKAAFEDFRPDRGLLLETRRFNGGNPKDLKSMRAIIRKSGPLYGADYVSTVFHGFNPLGPSENCVSIYRGTLLVPEKDDYEVATSSDDASFLLIDGRQIVAWPGWHGAVADGRHAKTITLDRGPHRFEYLQVNGGGGYTCVAAWRKAGDEGPFRPIPRPAFPSVQRGHAGPPESADGGVVPAFDVTVVEETAYGDDRRVMLVSLLDRTSARSTNIRWAFGDGTAGRGGTAWHVYVKPGLYPITMTVSAGGRDHQLTQAVRIERRWSQRNAPPAPPGKLLQYLAGFDCAALRPNLLQPMTDFLASFDALERFDELEDQPKRAARLQQVIDLQKAAAEAVIARGTAAGGDLLLQQSTWLAHRLRAEQPDEALRYLDSAEAAVQDKPVLRAQLIREKGDIYFYYHHDLDRALDEYDKVVGRYTDLPDHIVRVTKIKIGDIHRKRGDYGRALENYRQAEALKLEQQDLARRTLRRGMLAQMAEDHLSRGNLPEARSAVDLLEWEFPQQKLVSHSTLLRVRLEMSAGNHAEAVKQARDLLRVNPASPHAPALLLQRAAAHQHLGQLPEAREALVALIREHPQAQSELLQDAIARLRGEGYRGVDDPQAMAAAAEGLQRLGRADEALSIYRKALERHGSMPAELKATIARRIQLLEAQK